MNIMNTAKSLLKSVLPVKGIDDRADREIFEEASKRVRAGESDNTGEGRRAFHRGSAD
jgi:hypothetical protein